MQIFEFFIFSSLIIYAILIGLLLIGIHKIKNFQKIDAFEKENFSIIVAFRNEELNLDDLLQSINKLNYPKDCFEVILVDDESSDNSVKIIESFNENNPTLDLKITANIRKTNAPKKDAIVTALAICKNNWIFTTDADCKLSENILSILNEFIKQKEAVMIAGLVLYPEGHTFLHQFQNFDWLSLTGFTMSGFGWKKPMICSGANLVYQKDAFLQINGFDGNEEIASGN